MDNVDEFVTRKRADVLAMTFLTGCALAGYLASTNDLEVDIDLTKLAELSVKTAEKTLYALGDWCDENILD